MQILITISTIVNNNNKFFSYSKWENKIYKKKKFKGSTTNYLDIYIFDHFDKKYTHKQQIYIYFININVFYFFQNLISSQNI